MAIYKISLEEKYQPKIYGLGEIYEMVSVERERKRLKERFGSGILFLCPNRQHSGRGLTPEELITKVKKSGYQILESGFVDSPPWKSAPGKKKNWRLPISWVEIIFKVLVILEFLWEGKKNSHLVYVLGRKIK